MEQREIVISPSLICMDLCDLKKSARELEALGIRSLHIDLIDGRFSPSMPLGLATVEQLGKITALEFDAHVMSMNNEFFIEELVKIGARSITFHYESAFHAERMLQLIRHAGIKCGVALNPATPLAVLDYVAAHCDYALLMLISPGYAGHAGETMVPYALDKIRACRTHLNELGSKAKIIVDGRVSLESISSLVGAGADVLVAGSTSLFRKEHSLERNFQIMRQSIDAALKGEKGA